MLKNEPGYIDSFDLVVRVNNFKTSEPTGFRTDVYFSFYGGSIRKTADELKRDGVTLCMAKCPNAKPIESEWHQKHGKRIGIDFRPIYRRRADWWFCDTYVPTVEEFMVGFNLLGRHMPSTGFAAILDVLSFEPSAVYLTGFDFFVSGVHNVDEPWRRKNEGDPIGHAPERELAWLQANLDFFPIIPDETLADLMLKEAA